MTDPFFSIDPSISPTDNLLNYLQDLQSAYDSLWDESDETTCQLVSELERISKDLLHSGSLFRPQGQITTLSFAERLIPYAEKDRSSLLRNSIATTTIELALLNNSVSRITRYRARLVEIIGVVRDLPFDGFTQRYLEEMSQLYLDGHDLAVYITARAALEESLKEIIEHLLLRDQLLNFAKQSDPRFWPSLDWMISFAFANGRLLPRALGAQATHIRERGNWALHQREKLVEAAADFPPVQAIKSLSVILRSLAAWKR